MSSTLHTVKEPCDRNPKKLFRRQMVTLTEVFSYFSLPAQYIYTFLSSHLHLPPLNLPLCFECQAKRKEWLLHWRDREGLLCFSVAAAKLSTSRLGR